MNLKTGVSIQDHHNIHRSSSPTTERTVYSSAYVRSLFNAIAHRYDFLNHFLSGGIDILWRKKAVQLLADIQPNTILDVATGTGDLAIEAARLQPKRIIGIDIAQEMLVRAEKKVREKNLSSIITFRECAVEQLPFHESEFDAAMAAFGVRNFENLHQGLHELYRVIRPKGMLLVLEFSHPKKTPVKQLYNFYSHFVMPVIGRFFSLHKTAYSYLPSTIHEFPAGEDFLTILQQVGFSQCRQYPLTFGIATIYTAMKGKS